MPDDQIEWIQTERLRQADLRRQREQDIDFHVQALQKTREEIETKLRDYQKHCDNLQTAVRRSIQDESTIRYKSYANVQTRMGGAMGQALKRASSMDRLLDLGKLEREEALRREQQGHQQSRVRQMSREVFNLQLPREDDFEALYGNEAEVTNAP